MLTNVSWIRFIEDWNPKNKSTETLFKSLVKHLIEEYKMPEFMYSIFYMHRTGETEQYVKIFADVAQGKSLFKAIKEHMSLVITKKMAHMFYQSHKSFSFFYALRYAQLRSLGANSKLIHAITTTAIGREEMNDEEFIFSVMQWFCNQQANDMAVIGPLIDFIFHCKQADESFSMKGRSLKAMLKGMEEWHHELAMHRKLFGISYKTCGFKNGYYKTKQKTPTGIHIDINWSIVEILNSKDLVAEGRKLSHCVASYSYQIEIEKTSIWSLKRDDIGVITIEVRNNNRTIVQARGKCNRLVIEKEKAIIKKWAADNGLNTSVVYW